MVLRSSAEQRDAANVNLLDGVSEGGAGPRDGRLERIQVAHYDVDFGDRISCKVLRVALDISCKDSWGIRWVMR